MQLTRIDHPPARKTAGEIRRTGPVRMLGAYARLASNDEDADAAAPTLDDYRATLERHDWSFEYSCDAAAYRAGRTSLLAITSMQPQLDPDFAVWNQHAPAAYRRSAA